MTSFERKVEQSSLGTRKVTAARATAPAGAAARAVSRATTTTGRFAAANGSREEKSRSAGEK